MNYETFGERRNAIRALRHTHTVMREILADVFERGGFAALEVDDVSLTLPREAFERCEWALQYVKQWLPDVDEETGNLRKTGRMVRMNALYVSTRYDRPHFLLKARPVFCEDAT